MKQTTLFHRLKTFINNTYNQSNAIFSTRDMCKFVDEWSTNPTGWKRWNKNFNYTTHYYLGHLHDLGCVTRIKHGHYKINAPIPNWFGSYHFEGLKGKLEDKSNLYWNSLPAWQKVNPWAEPEQIRIEDALGGWPDYEPIREQYPANVEGSIEQRITAMEDLVNEQTKKLQDIKNQLLELQALADEQNQVEVRYITNYVNRIYEVTYRGIEYQVKQSFNEDDVFDEYWLVDDYREQISNTEIAEYLINWVKENCK